MKRHMVTMMTQLPTMHKSALRRLAQADAETMAAVLRRLIRQEACRRGVWPEPEGQPQEEVDHA